MYETNIKKKSTKNKTENTHPRCTLKPNTNMRLLTAFALCRKRTLMNHDLQTDYKAHVALWFARKKARIASNLV